MLAVVDLLFRAFPSFHAQIHGEVLESEAESSLQVVPISVNSESAKSQEVNPYNEHLRPFSHRQSHCLPTMLLRSVLTTPELALHVPHLHFWQIL